MAKTFFCELITPERSFYKGDIEMLVVETGEGELGIMADHMPMVVSLVPGIIRIRKDGRWKEAANGHGFIEIRPDETIVLAQTMEWPEEIEINRVREAMERAEEELRQQQSLREYQLSKATMARCFARLRLRCHYDNDQL